MKFYLTGNLNMQQIEYSQIKMHKKYLFIHHLKVGLNTIWHREYVGIIYKQIICNDMVADISSSYDYCDKNEPHTGRKQIIRSMKIYEMVPQAQNSMEKRSLTLILQRIDENFII